MLKYKHRKFGHIVDVPEPADVIAAAEAEATALTRIGTKDAKRRAEAIGEYAQWQANRQRQTLNRMDESRKWERYTPPVEEPRPAAKPVDDAVEPKPVKRTTAKVETAE